jgi:hypothetical protein
MSVKKLKRCEHIEKTAQGYERCGNLTDGKWHLPDGKSVPICAGHIRLYDKKSNERSRP